MAPESQPGRNAEELGPLLHHLNRLVREREHPLQSIGEHGGPEQDDRQQERVTGEALQRAAEFEQQQPGEKGVGDVQEGFAEVAVMHQEHVVQAEPQGKAPTAEGELAIGRRSLDLTARRREQRNRRRRHPEEVANAGEKALTQRGIAGLGEVPQHEFGADALCTAPKQRDRIKHRRWQQGAHNGGTHGGQGHHGISAK